MLETHGVRVELFDERLTTVSAHQALTAGGTRGRDQRAVVDQTAAAVLLMAWLDGRRSSR
jgi:putative Holliday junction resolvase